MPLTFEATRAAGATLGSGVIMVFDETADLVDTLRRIAQFFRDESCGQCVPCRVGTVRQEELLGPPRRRLAGPDRGTRSSRSCARSARRCATRRSAGSARPRRRRSSPPCASRIWWRCERRPEHGSRPGARRADAARRPGLGRPAADRHPADAARPGEQAADRAGRRGATRRFADDRRRRGHGPGRDDDPRRLPDPGDRHADAVLRREPDAGQRLPGVRRRGHRLARAGPRLLATGRSRDGRPDRLRARPALAQDGPRVPRLVGRPVAGRSDRPRRLDRGVRRALRRGRHPVSDPRPPRRRPANATRSRPATITRPPATPRPPRSPSRRRSTTTSTSAITRSASSATSASMPAARRPRTRSRSPSPGAVSMPGSRPSRPSRSPNRRASTAATASASARPER